MGLSCILLGFETRLKLIGAEKAQERGIREHKRINSISMPWARIRNMY